MLFTQGERYTLTPDGKIVVLSAFMSLERVCSNKYFPNSTCSK
jgi:hypothetical protein